MRVATWNVNSIVPRLPRVLDWLEHTAPDVLCLQELKNTTEAFPVEPVRSLGYEVAAYGLGRWNGVAILSKVGLEDVVRGLPGEPQFDGQAEARAIGATCGGVRVWSVYVPNGREPGNPHYAYKLAWLAALRDLAGEELAADRPFAVLGDFNVAPADDDVWDLEAFAGSTHVTGPERAALAALREAGLTDVFPRPLKYDHPFTYWDYRAGNFPNNRGMRIDLVYGNPAFTGAVTDSYVDREARKGKGPSDHAPIVVDLAR
ncbi:exodeoxyribonuclease III [Amycolatopsis jiangsuensis]|uniref:Exodeoxyribonuclease-3 n=1 Tax=Amycolatopsis jiangsuensis TaxID=1181879 RepID=A0A840IUE9_9PSEU|nr:exodeoxyribonuclease III [Amycolatopsis jiangsuensis]MBB4684604.1 exodeoxyribonuclease-3 [Amycolatopsis jiangsuensis]